MENSGDLRAGSLWHSWLATSTSEWARRKMSFSATELSLFSYKVIGSPWGSLNSLLTLSKYKPGMEALPCRLHCPGCPLCSVLPPLQKSICLAGGTWLHRNNVAVSKESILFLGLLTSLRSVYNLFICYWSASLLGHQHDCTVSLTPALDHAWHVAGGPPRVALWMNEK